MKKRLSIIILAFFITFNGTVFAHSGRTDSSGGHKDNQNASGLGYYHFHCSGNPPHLHNDGICPYSTNSRTSSSNKTLTQNKQIQEKLNELGYDCGKADGKFGKKTKTAIKQFQKDNNLTVDGIVGQKTLKALGL